MIASSLTRAILTLRNTFSYSLTNSATVGLETSATMGMIWRYRSAASRVQAGVTPPTTLGVFVTVKVRFPGSIRSGENARKKSTPTLAPRDSNRGRSISSVVPG